MDIHHDLEKIKLVALDYAIKQNRNFNIIILNPNENGEFDEKISTYEFVLDSYFEKERSNAKILFTTDELRELPIEPFFIDGEGREFYPSFSATNRYLDFPIAISSSSILQRRTPQYIRQKSKIGRNSPCVCSSGKKYKNCCLI